MNFGMTTAELVRKLLNQGLPYEQALAVANKINAQDLSSASFADMTQLRNMPGAETLQQDLAPFEHRAFVREATTRSPATGAFLGAVASPAYEGLKAMPDAVQRFVAQAHPMLDVTQSRSGPMLSNITQGLLGAGEGLAERLGFSNAQEQADAKRSINELQGRIAGLPQNSPVAQELVKQLQDEMRKAMARGWQ